MNALTDPTDAWVEKLYRETFPLVANMVARDGGTLDQAKDIFHDALIILLEKQQQDKLQIKVSWKAYLAGIARILWIRSHKSNPRHTSLGNVPDSLAIPADYYSTERITPVSLLNHLQSAGKKCLELLQAFYYDNRTMQDIAATFQFKTRHSATVQKYKCLEKVRKTIQQSEVYEKSTA